MMAQAYFRADAGPLPIFREWGVYGVLIGMDAVRYRALTTAPMSTIGRAIDWAESDKTGGNRVRGHT